MWEDVAVGPAGRAGYLSSRINFCIRLQVLPHFGETSVG